ncbi:MAG: DUF853 family protein [Firmicutes bacterium]|nr:DUF853 family protein [Bacillota bacterium]
MLLDNNIYVGLDQEGNRVNLNLSMSNRHGLIAGATGTGKTITMKVLAESFADAGVPVFLCDVKGDVSGICTPGEQTEDMEARIDKFGLRDYFKYKGYTTTFWDIYGENGHPIRATVSDMGPELLARILGLTDVQEGVLNIIFRIADDNGLLLIDLKDLRAMVNYVGDHKDEYTLQYGNIAQASLGGIVRAILPIENQGGNLFFGEPDLDIMDWIRTDINGNGMINVLDSVKLVNSPKIYAIFLLWMMAELFEKLPEEGDMEKPKMVFFFDEAHFLFTDMPSVFIQKIEQMVKLIRSKGVGVFFVTQNPADIPDSVLAQLSNKVQHALRAYTPAEQKAVRAAAQSFRENPAFKTEDVIMELGTGEALVSFLDEKGIPAITQRTKIVCPQSLMGPADPAIRESMMSSDGMNKYDTYMDNESAYEVLHGQAQVAAEEAKLAAEREAFEREKEEFAKQKAKEEAAAEKEALKAQEKAAKEALKAQEKAEKEALKAIEKEQRARERQAQNAVGSVGSTLGREFGKLVGNTIGGSLGKKVGGNLGSTLARGFFKNLIGRK